MRSSRQRGTNVDRGSKNLRWAEEMVNINDIAEVDTSHENRPSPGSSENNVDHRALDEQLASFEDSFPLISDLLIKSSTDQNYFSTSAESPRCIYDRQASIDEDEERQTALRELVTHLEDTAALLKQYLAPPPKPTFVDHIGSSGKTHFLLRYQLAFVLSFQLAGILIISLFDHLSGEGSYTVLSRVIGTTLQIFSLMLVIFATVILSRQMLRSNVDGSFLAQTYVATVITFAGLYFIIYRFNADTWEFASLDKMEDSYAIVQYIKMIYLSVSAATLCGAANIQPRVWFAVLLLCFQSLINFVYFASILAQTIGNYNSYTVQVRRSASMSRINTSRSQRRH